MKLKDALNEGNSIQLPTDKVIDTFNTKYQAERKKLEKSLSDTVVAPFKKYIGKKVILKRSGRQDPIEVKCVIGDVSIEMAVNDRARGIWIKLDKNFSNSAVGYGILVHPQDKLEIELI